MERDNLLHFVSMFWNGSLTNGIILIYLAVRTAKLVIYHTRKSGSDSIFSHLLLHSEGPKLY